MFAKHRMFVQSLSKVFFWNTIYIYSSPVHVVILRMLSLLKNNIRLNNPFIPQIRCTRSQAACTGIVIMRINLN